MNRIVLRLRADGGGEWIGSDGVVHDGWPVPRREDRVVVLVPADEVLLLEVAAIPGSERQWSRALPFLVEEQLVSPVESQHLAWARASRDAPIRVAVVARARLEGWLAQLRTAGVEPDAMFSEALASPMHALVALPALPVLDLLCGDYAPRRRSDGLARHWRRTAMMAGAALLLALLYPVLDRYKLAGKVAAQRLEMEQLYRRAMPSALAVDAPARRLRAALAARGLERGEGAMALLAQAAPAIAADDRLTLDSLEYRGQHLELVIQASGVADLDALRQRLSRAGIAAEIIGTTPGTRGVQGRLRLGSAP